MRSKVSSKRERVSLSILRIASSSVSSASVRSLHCAIQVGLALGLLLQLVDGGEVHLARAARGRPAPSASWSSRSAARLASATQAASTSSRSKRVCANCSTSDSRRRRVSCAASRAASSSSRACATRRSAEQPLFVELAQLGIADFQVAARCRQFAPRLPARRQQHRSGRASQLADRLVAVGQIPLRAAAGALQLLRCSCMRCSRGRSSSRWSGGLRAGSAARAARAGPPAPRARLCDGSRRSSRSPSSRGALASSCSSCGERRVRARTRTRQRLPACVDASHAAPRRPRDRCARGAGTASCGRARWLPAVPRASECSRCASGCAPARASRARLGIAASFSRSSAARASMLRQRASRPSQLDAQRLQPLLALHARRRADRRRARRAASRARPRPPRRHQRFVAG